jgi:hypothetical protein
MNIASAPAAPSIRGRSVAAHFAGRTVELEGIDEALGRADRAVVTQAITGLGGVGKSQVAARSVQQP